jgi:CO/xanthine dehydrogenase Mo-binding subunit
VLDFRLPPRRDQIQFGDDNVLKRLRIDKGEVDSALERAPYVIEAEYETGAQEHVYLETQGMVAWEADGVITVTGSMQCPYYIVNAFKRALHRSEDRIRIIQAPTGGGFGGKEEFPSGLALHAALLALKSGQVVKMIYDRAEDMAVSTKRHPSRVRHRTGLAADGRLLAQDIEVVLDAGAYVTLSPVVLSRSIIHAAGPYACEHVRIEGRAIFTNAPPFGAFRGFGAPQSLFACERHMDRIAAELRIDPVELRRVNLIRDGETTATGQVIRDGSDRVAVMERALELSGFERRRAEHVDFNAAEETRRRGVGLATFFHGAGFTGSGEVYLDSEVHVAGLPDGRIEVRTANVEMGQGTLTVFTQLAAERLGVPPEWVMIARVDTSVVPDSGPTVASRTVMVVGGLVERACDDLRRRLGIDPESVGQDDGDAAREAGPGGDRKTGDDEVIAAIRSWHLDHPGEELRGSARYRPPADIQWDDRSYRGDAYAAFAWGAYVADVEVDLRTFSVSVRDFVAVQEIGRVLNETLARGQIQGGVVQALGWALLEECKWRDGALENAQLTNYVIPTSADVPPIRVEFLETPCAHGAGGAKGIGELPFDGVAPAVANALAAAGAGDPRVIPLTPERVMDLFMGSAEEGH